jgi:hypothetical protein
MAGATRLNRLCSRKTALKGIPFWRRCYCAHWMSVKGFNPKYRFQRLDHVSPLRSSSNGLASLRMWRSNRSPRRALWRFTTGIICRRKALTSQTDLSVDRVLRPTLDDASGAPGRWRPRLGYSRKPELKFIWCPISLERARPTTSSHLLQVHKQANSIYKWFMDASYTEDGVWA